MSLWQFQAAVVGWGEAHGVEAAVEMTDAEFEAARAVVDSFPDRVM